LVVGDGVLVAVADPEGRGAVWGNCPSPNACGAPLPYMRSFLVPMEVETEIIIL